MITHRLYSWLLQLNSKTKNVISSKDNLSSRKARATLKLHVKELVPINFMAYLHDVVSLYFQDFI